MDSPAWCDSTKAHKAAFIALLAAADHGGRDVGVPGKDEPVHLEPGAVIMGYRPWAEAAELGKNAVRQARERLEELGIIHVGEASQRGTLIEVQNWSDYIAEEGRHAHDTSQEAQQDKAHHGAQSLEGKTYAKASDPMSYMPKEGDDFDHEEVVKRVVDAYREVWGQPNMKARGEAKGRIVERYREWHDQYDRPAETVVRHSFKIRSQITYSSLHAIMSPAQFENILLDYHTQDVGINEDVVQEVVGHYKEVFGADEVRVTSQTQHQIMECWESGKGHSDTPVRDAIDRAKHLAETTGDRFWLNNNSLHDITKKGIFEKLFEGAIAPDVDEEEGSVSDKDLADKLREMVGNKRPESDIEREAENVF